jgi:hypothetical protein
MRLLPYREIEIESALPALELTARLARYVQPQRWFRLPWTKHELFEGQVSGASFRIQRVIAHGNAFLPVVEGQIVNTSSGSAIRATLHLKKFVAGFLGFGVAFTAIGMLDLLFRRPLEALAVPLFMAIWLGFPWLAFHFEARRACQELREIAEGPSEGRGVAGAP